MAITKFRIKSRRPNRPHESFSCEYFHTPTGKFRTLFTDGVSVFRQPMEVEVKNRVVMHEIITSVTSDEKGVKWLYKDYEFYTGDDLMSKTPDEIELSQKHQSLYDFIMGGHSSFAILDEKGENINKNAMPNPLFELVNLTKMERDKEKYNKDLADASMLLKQLAERNDDFIEFCFAYGVPVNSNMTQSMLYNACAIKMQNNPSHFLKLLGSADMQLTALVNRGLNVETQNEHGETSCPLVMRGDGTVFFDGLPIGNGIKEAVEYFKINDAERRALEIRLGVRNSFTKKIKILEEADINNLELKTLEETENLQRGINNDVLSLKMKNDILNVYNKYKTKIKQKEKLSDLRLKYQAEHLLFDQMVENLNPDNQSHGVPQEHIVGQADVTLDTD